MRLWAVLPPCNYPYSGHLAPSGFCSSCSISSTSACFRTSPSVCLPAYGAETSAVFVAVCFRCSLTATAPCVRSRMSAKKKHRVTRPPFCVALVRYLKLRMVTAALKTWSLVIANISKDIFRASNIEFIHWFSLNLMRSLCGSLPCLLHASGRWLLSLALFPGNSPA